MLVDQVPWSTGDPVLGNPDMQVIPPKGPGY